MQEPRYLLEICGGSVKWKRLTIEKVSPLLQRFFSDFKPKKTCAACGLVLVFSRRLRHLHADQVLATGELYLIHRERFRLGF